jgi:hypothetical protein
MWATWKEVRNEGGRRREGGGRKRGGGRRSCCRKREGGGRRTREGRKERALTASKEKSGIEAGSVHQGLV